MSRTSRIPVAIGLRAQRGGAVTVGVALDDGEPRVIGSSWLATATAGDRLTEEPYHVAFEMPRGPDGGASAEAAAAVAEGRRRQDELAANGLTDLLRTLRDSGCRPVAAALLVNRAGWITDLLAHSLSFPEHPPVAEGLAVRDALRFAAGRCGLELVEVDEKSLPERAAPVLGLGRAELDGRLKALGKAAGGPWRKEQKLACLAAWVTLAESRTGAS